MMPLLEAFIVEGSAVDRETLAATLEELARVRVVGSAEDEASAVAWLKDAGHHCDVIIDISLKRGSGLTVLQTAGSLRPEIHSVMLTNHAAPEVRRRSEQLGAQRVFDKSDNLDAMIQYFNRMARDAAGSREPPAVT